MEDVYVGDFEYRQAQKRLVEIAALMRKLLVFFIFAFVFVPVLALVRVLLMDVFRR